MNLLTNSMERMFKLLSVTDKKLGEMATLPYGTKKLSSTEQRAQIDNLTEEEAVALVDEYGLEEVADWMESSMQRRSPNG